MSTTDDARAIAEMTDAEFEQGMERLERATIGSDEWRKGERVRAEIALYQAFETALERLGYQPAIELLARMIADRGEEERERDAHPERYADLYQCDGCGLMKPSDEVLTIIVYGCEGDFCAECRGERPVHQHTFGIDGALRCADCHALINPKQDHECGGDNVSKN